MNADLWNEADLIIKICLCEVILNSVYNTFIENFASMFIKAIDQ